MELAQATPDGPATQPRRISAPQPRSEEYFEGVEMPRGIPVFELVINTEGRVESVVSLRRTSPELDVRLAGLLKQWTFEPARVEGEPICTRLVMTTHVHPR